MKINKLNILFIVIILSLSLAFFFIYTNLQNNRKIQTTENTTNKEIQTKHIAHFTNDKFSYSFEYDASLTCAYNSERQTSVMCRLANNHKNPLPKDKYYSFIITTHENNTLSLEEASEQIKNNAPNVIISDENIANSPAKKIINITQQGNNQWYNESHIFRHNNDLYNIEYFSETGNTTNLKSFYNLINSFKFNS